ncbi:MAG TPA: haloacid dehalogenase type II [Terriglobales bacterium]|nr:haloacid dehalogenase type II [Terriglobales bacterium]
MPHALGFDVYGTLVDVHALVEQLRSFAGDQAQHLSELWRQKQVEYAFRRGLMRNYQDFGVCTAQALTFALRSLKINLPEADELRMLSQYLNLPPYSDVVSGLEILKANGHRVVAFSNGTEKTVHSVLDNAGILSLFSEVISVDDLKTFKPDPRVYEYLAERLGRDKGSVWLVSSNAWDVIGAKSAGLKAAWIRRKEEAVFDPWEIEPDVVVHDLMELGKAFS